MNHLKLLCAMLMLLSALTLSARGGDISCGGALQQPCKDAITVEEPVEETPTGPETTGGELFETMLTLVQGVLSVF